MADPTGAELESLVGELLESPAEGFAEEAQAARAAQINKMGVHLMAIDDCTIASVGPRRSLLGPRPLLAAGNEVAARPDRDSAVLNVGSLL